MITDGAALSAFTPQQRWQRKLREVEHLSDSLGRPLDEGIRETVAMFQLVGLQTRQSCEGHVDHGLPVPWVDLYVPETATLREELVSLEEQLDELEEGTQAFCRVLCRRNVVWKQEAQVESQAWMLLFSLLERFYRERAVPYDQRLVLHPSGRFTVHGGMLQPARDAETKVRKLADYQEEVQRFTKFLKRRFLKSKL